MHHRPDLEPFACLLALTILAGVAHGQSGRQDSDLKSDPWSDEEFVERLALCTSGSVPGASILALRGEFPQYDLYPVLERIYNKKMTTRETRFDAACALRAMGYLKDPRAISTLREILERIPPQQTAHDRLSDESDVFSATDARFYPMAVEATLAMEAKDLYPLLHQYFRETGSIVEMADLVCAVQVCPRVDFEGDLEALARDPRAQVLHDTIRETLDLIRRQNSGTIPTDTGTTSPSPSGPHINSTSNSSSKSTDSGTFPEMPPSGVPRLETVWILTISGVVVAILLWGASRLSRAGR